MLDGRARLIKLLLATQSSLASPLCCCEDSIVRCSTPALQVFSAHSVCAVVSSGSFAGVYSQVWGAEAMGFESAAQTSAGGVEGVEFESSGRVAFDMYSCDERGYRKLLCLKHILEVFGTLEIVNLNSLDIQYSCESCRGGNVSRQLSNPFCVTCGKLVSILKTPVLQAKLIAQIGKAIIVTLQGLIVDEVLGLSQPFTLIYENNLSDL
ncbi:hypothetical protein L7F22_040959 [Adiantum nelumboides]|nr:hypothetical protein [Adiantum nelumboides]